MISLKLILFASVFCAPVPKMNNQELSEWGLLGVGAGALTGLALTHGFSPKVGVQAVEELDDIALQAQKLKLSEIEKLNKMADEQFIASFDAKYAEQQALKSERAAMASNDPKLVQQSARKI
jgi:hypothetical protein